MNYEISKSRGWATNVFINTTQKEPGKYEYFAEISEVVATKEEAEEVLKRFNQIRHDEVDAEFNRNIEKLRNVL
jgi:hypothetical protein